MAIVKNGSTYSWASGAPGAAHTTGNFTVAGGLSNSILIVRVSTRNAETTWTPPKITGVKWGGSGGVALTRIVYHYWDKQEVSLWCLIAPSAQTSTIYVTLDNTPSTGVVVLATVYQGAEQSYTPRSTNSAHCNYGLGPLTTSLSSAVGDLVLDACTAGDDSATEPVEFVADGGQTKDIEKHDGGSGYYTNRAFCSQKDGAATVSMSYTWAVNNEVGLIAMASFKPYVSAETPINIALAVGGS